MTKALSYDYVSGWCAATKVSGLNAYTITYPQNTLSNIVNQACEGDDGTSCILVSSNAEEVELNQWLEQNKFIRGPEIQNWNHDGRETYLWFYQVDEETYMEYAE